MILSRLVEEKFVSTRSPREVALAHRSNIQHRLITEAEVLPLQPGEREIMFII
jgi:hypothetical protein